MSVEIVLYQKSAAFRICNEGVILALVALLFWVNALSLEFSTVSSCSCRCHIRYGILVLKDSMH